MTKPKQIFDFISYLTIISGLENVFKIVFCVEKKKKNLQLKVKNGQIG